MGSSMCGARVNEAMQTELLIERLCMVLTKHVPRSDRAEVECLIARTRRGSISLSNCSPLFRLVLRSMDELKSRFDPSHTHPCFAPVAQWPGSAARLAADPSRPSLEDKSSSDLCRSRDVALRCNLAEGATGGRADCGSGKAGVVQSVEAFEAEFEEHPFSKVEILQQR
jgi:hypothetical protein